MKVNEIPLADLTIGALMELQRHGVKGIVDGDQKVFRIIWEDELDTLETEFEVLLQRLN